MYSSTSASRGPLVAGRGTATGRAAGQAGGARRAGGADVPRRRSSPLAMRAWAGARLMAAQLEGRAGGRPVG